MCTCPGQGTDGVLRVSLSVVMFMACLTAWLGWVRDNCLPFTNGNARLNRAKTQLTRCSVPDLSVNNFPAPVCTTRSPISPSNSGASIVTRHGPCRMAPTHACLPCPLRPCWQGRIDAVSGLAHKVKAKLDGLDKDNEAAKKAKGGGEGSAAERTRTSITAGLKKKLKVGTWRRVSAWRGGEGWGVSLCH
jgi:hypothetical protein